MNLQEVFDNLSAGEFSQLSIAGGNSGVIDAGNYRKVATHVSLGLTSLFKRFNLKERKLIIALQEGLLDYKLHSVNAVTGTGSGTKYILDSLADPFTDDIIKVKAVMTDQGLELGLNDSANAYSVFTPSALALTVPKELVVEGIDAPEELITDTLSVVYWANHPKIVVPAGEFDPSTVELELPETHMEALLYYVASRVNNPIGMTNEFHAGNSYWAKYESACQALEYKGLQVDQGSQNTRAVRNGWV